jgi:hypothetical protein
MTEFLKIHMCWRGFIENTREPLQNRTIKHAKEKK